MAHNERAMGECVESREIVGELGRTNERRTSCETALSRRIAPSMLLAYRLVTAKFHHLECVKKGTGLMLSFIRERVSIEQRIDNWSQLTVD